MIKFYVDNLSRDAVKALRNAGFDVVYSAEIGMSTSIKDKEHVKYAQQESRILLTADTRLAKECNYECSVILVHELTINKPKRYGYLVKEISKILNLYPFEEFLKLNLFFVIS